MIKDENISIMITIDENRLVWADPSIDITSSVIAQLANLANDQK